MSFRPCILAIVFFLLGGCAAITGRQPDIAEIDQLTASQQYGRALDLLARVDPASPDYSKASGRRSQIESLAADYELMTLTLANQEIQQDNWEAALERYDEALERLPKSAALRDGLTELHRRQNLKLEKLGNERLLARGRWLKETLPTHSRIAQVNPRSRSARRQLDQIRQQADEVGGQLAQFGNQAMADNQLEIARQALQLAHDLNGSQAVAESINKLEQELAGRRSQQQQQQQQQQRAQRPQQLRQHQDGYQAARAANDFPAARKQLSQLRRLEPDNTTWVQEQLALERAIQTRTETLLTQGINAYSRGNYEEAARSWRELLILDPDHKLARENLERAERVLQRIKELQQRGDK